MIYTNHIPVNKNMLGNMTKLLLILGCTVSAMYTPTVEKELRPPIDDMILPANIVAECFAQPKTTNPNSNNGMDTMTSFFRPSKPPSQPPIN